MIQNTRAKNLVSNYLKGIDQQVRGAVNQKSNASRNQALVAPAATKKMTKNTMGSVIEGSGEVTNKSLVGRYY